MSKRRAWLLGVVTLILIALLLACSSTYNSSSDGLLVIGSQGSALLQSFSFSLASGRVAQITNTVQDTADLTCQLPGFPYWMILDPSGTHAYVIMRGTSQCPGPTDITVFDVNGDGTLSDKGTTYSLNTATVGVCLSGSSGQPTMEPDVAVLPVYMAMDSAGQYLFVADSATNDSNGNAVPGAISVFSVSNGTLTEVTGSPFTVPVSCNVPPNNLTTLAVSPTVFPPIVNGVLNAVCSNNTPPTAEYLYVADSTLTGMIWEFSVDTSTGALGPPPDFGSPPSFQAGQVPSGIAVDPCNRFVYVSNQGTSNSISAFSICNGGASQSSSCPPASVLPNGDGSLRAITGSPFSNIGSANFPGQIVVDAYGNFVYVLNGTNNISPFRISTVSGSITPLTPSPVAAGSGATAMALRSDDSWLFVSNFIAATVSQYSMSPSTGSLVGVPSIQTDNYPYGLAVK